MACDERRRLQYAYTNAARDFNRAVADLRLSRGTPEFKQTSTRTKSVRQTALAAQNALSSHKSQHGC